MLHQFGTGNCPRCTTKLVHEYDLANDWVLPSEQVGTDQRWICTGCGYSRPVTYQVDRPSMQQPQVQDASSTVRRGIIR
ncbi:MAG: hypothetical protein AB7P33_05515 [Dehalococcoidia bacterium]